MINRLIYIYISIWFTNFNIKCSAAIQSYLFCLVLTLFLIWLQRRIRHESPFALYVNCRNHRLALCLVHLIKKYPVLQEIDSLLISLWKLLSLPLRRWLYSRTSSLCMEKTHWHSFVLLQQDGCLISMHVQDLYQGNFKFIRDF